MQRKMLKNRLLKILKMSQRLSMMPKKNFSRSAKLPIPRRRSNPRSLSGSKATSKLPYLKELQERQEHFQTRGPEEWDITGIPTHFIDLDKMINGLCSFQPDDSRGPSCDGKNSSCAQYRRKHLLQKQLPVGIFSLEMTAEQLLHRIICSQAEVESDKIRTGSINGHRISSASSAAVNAHAKTYDDHRRSARP